MIIVGLTGSIGMGKSTAGKAFRRLGLPVHDADAAVHRLFAKGGRLVPVIGKAFPGAVIDGMVDRQALGRQVLENPAALRRLEGIVHPAVREEELAFLKRCVRQRWPAVVLDIPLLFETGGDRRCDLVVAVWAPDFVQARRVLKRPGMTPEKLAAIRAQQTPDAEKRRRAHMAIPTGRGRGHSFRLIRSVVRQTRRIQGHRWPPRPIARSRNS